MATQIMNGRTIAREVPVPDEKLAAHTEQIAGYAVHNRWLRLALAGMLVTIVGLCATVYKVTQIHANVKPVVIRINEVGQPVASEYSALEYQPREAEIRYFLTNFVVDHYSRIRATRRAAFQRQLYFMDAAHSRATMEQETVERSIPRLLSGSEDEVDVRVQNVAIQELTPTGGKAQAQFEKVYLAAADHRELKRENYVGQFTFAVLPSVPASFVTVNPLGLVVSYFREDQAFQ